MKEVALGEFLALAVTIPHGGLGTDSIGVVFAKAHESPSHAVGLEHRDIENATYLKVWESPSHPVGLEHCLPKTLKTKALTLSKLKQPTERAH